MRGMVCTHISRASSALLFVAGLALLFAADVILPRLVPGFPETAAWTGQLLAAAWLAVAALSWISRSSLLGGIYGRPVVMTNAVLYFVSAMVLLSAVRRADAQRVLWLLIVPAAVFAALYGWLLFRGPFESDLEMQRRAQLDRS